MDIGGADGLVHLSELSWSRVRHPSEVLRKGSIVQAVILSIDAGHKRLSLGVKQLQQCERAINSAQNAKDRHTVDEWAKRRGSR